MNGTLPATTLTTERIRSAAKHLEQDSRRVQCDLNANTAFFKIVAEDMERENNFEAVAALRQGLLEVLDCAHRLEYQCSAMQNISQTFEAGMELTDFKKQLDESTKRYLAAAPFEPKSDKFYEQFSQAIWNIHHAGEGPPGQDQEEMVVLTCNTIINDKCPLTGKPVTEIEDPVRSIECRHIYDQAAVMSYIARSGRRRCSCAIPGCAKELKKDRVVCDATLKMEIRELLQSQRVSQVAAYTDVDLEDDD